MAKEDAPNYKESQTASKCSNCDFGQQDQFCTLYNFTYDTGFICDSWIAIKGLVLEKPHAFLVWKGKQTVIAAVDQLTDLDSLLLLSDNDAYGYVSLKQPSQVNVSEFDKQVDRHCVYPEERRKWWANEEVFYLYEIDKLDRFVELDNQAESISRPVDKDCKFLDTSLTESERDLILKTKKLPRVITIDPEAVILTGEKLEALKTSIDSDELNRSLKAVYEQELKRADKSDGKDLPIYQLALVRKPKLLITEVEMQQGGLVKGNEAVLEKNDKEIFVAAKQFDDSPWDGSASRWDTAEAYCKDTLIDVNSAGEDKTKTLCKLPFRHPGATNPNEGAIRAIGGGRGFSALVKPDGIDQALWDKQVKAAANKVIGWWPKLFDKPAPDAVFKAAGKEPPVDGKSNHLFVQPASVEVITDDEGDKEVSLSRMVEQVHDAFREQYPIYWDTPGFIEAWIVEVFDTHLVVESDRKLYQVNYTHEDDRIVFDPIAEWAELEISYTPKSVEDAQKEKEGLLGKLRNAADKLKDLFDFVGHKEEATPEEVDFKEIDFETHPFGIKEVDGKLWYFTKSTNAFIDRDEEIFSTKALEEYVTRSIDKEQKGFFNFWHIPGTDFAEKEWMAVVGKFLVEAGPFLDNEAGQKALEFFTEFSEGHQDFAPEGWGCSPEFKFLPEDREDKIFDWLHIVRTSTLPLSAAANIYTDGGKVMALEGDRLKAAQALFGEEFVEALGSNLEKETQTLEEANIASKEVEEEITEKKEEVIKKEVEEVDPKEQFDTLVKAVSKEIVVDMQPIAEALVDLSKGIDELKTEVEGIKAKEEVKEDTETPRFMISMLDQLRATESKKTVTEEDKFDKPKQTAVPQTAAASFFGDK